jgi:5-oxoprolinase (ATP-hydrolysing) subunit A
MKRIDLNCDLGELPPAIADGTQEALMRSITSVNIACGGHAGDERTMKTTIEQALHAGVTIGAHPGYPDRANFGRLELKMPPDKLAESVCEQILALAKIAEECGARIVHVKPHGALYNQAVKNRELAEAIANGVAKAVAQALGVASTQKNATHCHPERSEGSASRPSPTQGLCNDVILVGLAGSPMLDVFRKAGFAVAAEAFADRRYEPDGTLRSRKFEDALIRDPAEAGWQALSIVERGAVTACDGSEVSVDAQTLCIHGDTPGAPEIAVAVARILREAGVTVRAPSRLEPRVGA